MAYEKGIVQGTVVEMQPIVSVEGIDAIPSYKPSLSTEYPSLIEMTKKFESDLGASGTTVEVVNAACKELGVNGAGLSLVQKAERAWDIMYTGHNRPSAGAPVMTSQPGSVVSSQPVKGAVSYSRLSIYSSTPVHSREEARYLLDEATAAPSAFGTSKWNAATGGRVQLEITVSGPPILLSHYALKSANDCPDRDPRVWSLSIEPANGGSLQVIHRVSDDGRKWSGRWQWQEWAVEPCLAASKFYLTVEGNHGDRHCTQLGQLRLFEWAAPAGPLTVLEARYGWAHDIWNVPLGGGHNHGGGAKDVTDIVRRDIVNNELHVNPERRGQYMNQHFWPETAGGPAIPRKLAVRYAYGGAAPITVETPAVANETVCLHVTQFGADSGGGGGGSGPGHAELVRRNQDPTSGVVQFRVSDSAWG